MSSLPGIMKLTGDGSTGGPGVMLTTGVGCLCLIFLTGVGSMVAGYGCWFPGCRILYANRGYVVLMRLDVLSCCRLLANLV